MRGYFCVVIFRVKGGECGVGFAPPATASKYRHQEPAKREKEREKENWIVCGLSELGWVNNHAIS